MLMPNSKEVSCENYNDENSDNANTRSNGSQTTHVLYKPYNKKNTQED